jgi:release factor glutamine methyltransferase
MISDPSARADDRILRKIMRAILPLPAGIYSPGDDTFLMLEALCSIPVEKKEVLDVGTGSGILGLFAALNGATVTATDTNKHALAHAREAAQTLGVSLNAVISDLFSSVKGRFDLVLFNPPYLPSSSVEDRAVDGGKQGASLTRRFLKNLKENLNSNGSALLLLSSQNNPGSLIAEHPEFDFSTVTKRPLFFEELQVLRVKPRRKAAR